MALFILFPTEEGERLLALKEWDIARKFVVRCDTEAEARKAAQDRGGDECRKWSEEPDSEERFEHPFWLDAIYSTCEILEPEGDPGVVIRDFHSGLPNQRSPTPYRQAVGDCGVANMTTAIEYDLEYLREQAMYSEPVEKPCRYAVIGCLLVVQRGFERDVVVFETDDLGLARIVADLESHCAGPNGWDAAIVWDQYCGREVPQALRSIRGGKHV